MPRTRTAPKHPLPDTEVICVSSDSENQPNGTHIKRRKIQPESNVEGPSSNEAQPSTTRPSKDAMSDVECTMDVDEWSPPQPSMATPISTTTAPSAQKPRAKNAHLKGRKRFMADLEDMRVDSADIGIETHGLQVGSFTPGDEEGSIELKILRGGQHLIALNLLIDDTASYPREHTFYSFALDVDIPPHVLQVVEKVSSAASKPLADTVTNLLASIAASLAQGKYIPQEDPDPTEDSQGYETESDYVGTYDDEADYYFETLPLEIGSQRKQFSVLRRHFLAAMKAGFKPGLTRLSDDDMVLSISSPVPGLSISPRALVAWDRRLLLSYQNLTLLISGIRGIYPILSSDGSFTAGNTQTKLKFHVGLSANYKPSKEVVLENVRNYGPKAGEEHDSQKPFTSLDGDEPPLSMDLGRFEKFSLSASLESLMSSQFISILQLRVRFKLGWAGAEVLHSSVMQTQKKPETLIGAHEQAIRAADAQEAQLEQTYSLPPDPLSQETVGELNLPLLAYSYLVRRFTLCSRFCLVCHTQIATTNFQALKPYVCDSKLCTYQYYALNFGTSIEYEICTNPEVVDLLVSLAYASAREHQLCEGLPVGLGLRVPVPTALPPPFHPHTSSGSAPAAVPLPDSDGLCDFDELPLPLMCAAITEMIDSLPSIGAMKAYLERKAPGKVGWQLNNMNEKTLPAAWAILRWCVASSTAYLEDISDVDELIPDIESNWRQFRFSVGAPDKEARFKTSLEGVQKVNENARTFPVIYGFHGSALKNWHSIIRQGLMIKNPVHGRAFGDGVYFAKDGAISMGHYAGGGTRWANSEIKPQTCVALAEIINSPKTFTSNNPYYVVQHVDWIMCRYLLVKTDGSSVAAGTSKPSSTEQEVDDAVQFVDLDPTQPLTMTMKKIRIPDQSHKLLTLLEARQAEMPEQVLYDEEDEAVLNGTLFPPSLAGSQVQSQSQDNHQGPVQREAVEDWQHNEEWCDKAKYVLLPPPTDSTPRAALALQKELRDMIKEQEKAVKGHALRELGWYLPLQLMGDNLFRWMLELHSFDQALPIAQDMVRHEVPSILFEVRFPASFPNQPPFFRIIKPRFLPFIAGGGGHVTGGGSICMDLLVSDGWLPSYSISAILLQIKLAISNLDPRPARLASNWDTPYGAAEALEGFKRAANAHGWQVPEGVDRLVY